MIKLKTTWATLSLLMLSNSVFASEKSNLYFDYYNMTLTSNGVFNPKVEGEKTGLNAELIARKNGMDNLQKYFENTCAGLDKSSLDVKSDWENNFHSQGTEIYSDGVLAVTLKGQIKQVFKIPLKLRKAIHTDENEKIAFHFPEKIPMSAIRCGSLEINLGNNKRIHVIPLDSVDSEESHVKTIHLVFNNKTSTLDLDPAFKENDSDIIENSTLADVQEISSDVLPILVSVDAQDE